MSAKNYYMIVSGRGASRPAYFHTKSRTLACFIWAITAPFKTEAKIISYAHE